MSGYCYRISKHLNQKRGSQFPHLTICAELWLHDRRTLVFIIDCFMYLIWLERNHCRNQYFSYGTKKNE